MRQSDMTWNTRDRPVKVEVEEGFEVESVAQGNGMGGELMVKGGKNRSLARGRGGEGGRGVRGRCVNMARDVTT